MSALTVAEAKNRFSDLLRRAEHGGERLVVHRHGRPVAAIISTDDLQKLEQLEEAEDLADVRNALAEAKDVGTYPLEFVLKEHGLEDLLVRERPPAPRTRPAPARRKAAKPASRGRRTPARGK